MFSVPVIQLSGETECPIMSTSNPKGAGRKPAPPHLKKNMVSVKLPQWLIEWTKSRPESRAVIIEKAICEKYGISPQILDK